HDRHSPLSYTRSGRALLSARRPGGDPCLDALTPRCCFHFFWLRVARRSTWSARAACDGWQADAHGRSQLQPVAARIADGEREQKSCPLEASAAAWTVTQICAPCWPVPAPCSSRRANHARRH